MELHGTARVIEIGALEVPWNSMELLVSSKWAHSKFHGIPWNCWCQFHGVRWNLLFVMEPLVSSIHWVLKWDRISWNLSFQILMKIIFNCVGWINFRKLINTLYLFKLSFTNWCFIINICIIPYALPALLIANQNIIQNLFSMLIETYFDQNVTWNFLQSSMELFEQHLNNICGSMEFHGIPWNFCPDPKFHGIPYNFFHTPEFHGIPWNSIELLIFPKKVPWNSMELFWISYLKKSYLLILFLVFDWWLDIIWLKSHRNVSYCIDFNIVIRILNTPVSAKMAQVSENGVLFSRYIYRIVLKGRGNFVISLMICLIITHQRNHI